MMDVPFMMYTIVQPGDFTAQHEVDEEKVQLYVNLLNLKTKFPPVVIAKYEDFNFVIDGHHRLYAAQRIGMPFMAITCSGEEYEDFCIEHGSHDGDRLILERANNLINLLMGR